MQTIQDLKGRQWNLHMTLRHARVIESQLKINILSPENAEESVLGLVVNPLKMIEILWILCAGQAQEAGVKRDDFEDAFDGKMYLEAEKALGEEIVFFIQSVDPTRSKLWTALLAKARKVSQIQVTKLEAFLDGTELEAMMEKEISKSIDEAITTLREATGNRSSNLAESSV